MKGAGYLGVLVVAGAAVAGLLSALSATAQGPTPIPSVWLQNATPGTAQGGNLNINGTGIFGGFHLTAGAADGRVLRGDASGNGTWGADGITLPYAGVIDTNGGIAFSVTATAGGGSGNMAGNFVCTAGGGTGVSGTATDTGFSTTFGVRGEAFGDGGRGVAGLGSGTGAAMGLHGHASNTTGANFGVWGGTSSSNGIGVQGTAFASTGTTYGLHGRVNSNAGAAVVGEAFATNGVTYGGRFFCQSASGRSVYAENTATTGINYGVYGDAASASGRGVRGSAGDTTVGTVPYGVYGQVFTATDGYAVYASGDMAATGVKPFRIDHPFDLLNKYLLHYATESPRPQNLYNGNATTDDNGHAWVDLPEYFEEINKDFRYTLTVVDGGDDFVLAKVSQRIKNNRFQIRTSLPNTEVDWMVLATRNDAYCRFKQPKDVMDKVAPEKGKVQLPELYGMPPQMGMDYDPSQPPANRRKS